MPLFVACGLWLAADDRWLVVCDFALQSDEEAHLEPTSNCNSAAKCLALIWCIVVEFICYYSLIPRTLFCFTYIYLIFLIFLLFIIFSCCVLYFGVASYALWRAHYGMVWPMVCDVSSRLNSSSNAPPSSFPDSALQITNSSFCKK